MRATRIGRSEALPIRARCRVPMTRVLGRPRAGIAEAPAPDSRCVARQVREVDTQGCCPGEDRGAEVRGRCSRSGRPPGIRVHLARASRISIWPSRLHISKRVISTGRSPFCFDRPPSCNRISTRVLSCTSRPWSFRRGPVSYLRALAALKQKYEHARGRIECSANWLCRLP